MKGCSHAALSKKSASGYRTASGSERDKNSTRDDGDRAINVDQNTEQIQTSS